MEQLVKAVAVDYWRRLIVRLPETGGPCGSTAVATYVDFRGGTSGTTGLANRKEAPSLLVDLPPGRAPTPIRHRRISACAGLAPAASGPEGWPARPSTSTWWLDRAPTNPRIAARLTVRAHADRLRSS